jgi:hypothetical protein
MMFLCPPVGSRKSHISPEDLLAIDSYNDAIEAIMVYGDSPSMLFNMDKTHRTEFARALIKCCVDVGLPKENLPPLWIGVLREPDLYENLARDYLAR